MQATECKAYIYCKNNIRKKSTPKYVKKQMRDFMRMCENKDPRFKVSTAKITQIENILKLLIMPKGLKAGQTLYECTCGYQWLVYTAALAVVHIDNPKRRRYETILLEICRKNYKTFTIAILFILLFFMEPPLSRFFSVAPDGALSREIKEAIEDTIKSSPLIYEYKGAKRFKILRDYVYCKTTQNKYTPLAYSNNRMDGKLPNVFVADEVGALPNSYAISAMRSGQLNILNKLGCIISTKYATLNNPFEDEVAYAKKVLDGIEKDSTYFALLYEPDNIKDWQTDNLILQQANPVALETPEIWEDLLKKRARAIAVESDRENFVTKHCNIIYAGAGTETYVDISAVQSCKVANINWRGRVVYVGLDLSESNDNTSVSIVAVDDQTNKILADSWAFIPADRIEEKQNTERVNYTELIKGGHVIPCGTTVIDYGAVEDFILNLENNLGVIVQAVGYDRWNATSTAQKLERGTDTARGLVCVEVRQHSSVLHPPTKLLKEKILTGDFAYMNNPLYEINFLNARCSFDTNKNLYVHKKRSTGKVDMVVSTINAVYLLQQDYFLNQSDFVIQTF